MPVEKAITLGRCPECHASFRLQPFHWGRSVVCANCKTRFVARQLPDSGPSETDAAGILPAELGLDGSERPVTFASTEDAAAAIDEMERCDLCHQYVPKEEFKTHRRSHEGVRDDGQLNEYPTLPPEQRYSGDLTGVPRWYFHPKCGQTTRMPEEIIRTYLVNPYFYAYNSYCGGCQTHVPMSELYWQATGESLMAYTRRLQRQHPETRQLRKALITRVILMSILGGLLLGGVGAAVALYDGRPWIALGVFVVGTLVGSVLAAGVLLGIRGGI